MDNLATLLALQSNPEAIPYFFAGGLMGLLALYGLRNRRSACGLSFGLMTAGSALWAIATGMELLSAAAAAKSAFLCLAVFGGAVGASWTFAFVREFEGVKGPLTPGRIALFFVEPVIVLAITAANPLHHLFWTEIDTVFSGNYLVAILSYGPLVLAHATYCLGLLIWSILILIRMGFKADPIYRTQIYLLGLAIVIPTALVFIQVVVSLPHVIHFRVRLLGLITSATLLGIALRKYRLLNITPAAREAGFRSQKDAVIIFDTKGRVLDANPAAIQAFGMKILGQEMAQAFASWPELCAKITAHEDGEWEIQRKVDEDDTSHFDIRLWPIEESGIQVGSILTIRDVTHRWILQEELLQAKEEAEASNRAKSAFLANMSHEIRTPLGAISGYGDILIGMEEPGSEKWSLLRQLKRNSSHLMHVIDDILDLSKIEAGKMDLDIIAYSPWQVLVETHASLAMKAVEKNLRLDLKCLGPLPKVAMIDPTRLRQILFNLLSNAIKFTESDRCISMEIGAQSTPDAKDPLVLTLKVTDEGIGMSQNQIGQLFQPFHQADGSTSRRFGGTGLGLSIVQKLVKMMGGEIEVDSTPGKGSFFLVRIPCRLPSPDVEWVDPLVPSFQGTNPPEEKPAQKEPMQGRLLLAEDNPDNQKILLYQLKSCGMEISLAQNGLEAVDQALRRPFDVILMDMQMPECDGYSATKQLRHAGYLGPIIALTANALKHDREICLSAGCSDYLAKPVTPDLLLKTIRCHLQTPATTAAISLNPSAQSPGSWTPVAPTVPESPYANDPEFLELVREFAGNLSARSMEILSALDQRDLPALRALSQQLKGAGRMYGFPEISQAARQLENAIINGGKPADLEPQAKKMAELMQAISGKSSAVFSMKNNPGKTAAGKVDSPKHERPKVETVEG